MAQHAQLLLGVHSQCSHAYRTFGIEPVYVTGAVQSMRDRPPMLGLLLWYVSQSLPSCPFTMFGAPGAITWCRAHRQPLSF